MHHCRFYLFHLHLFQAHNNTDADCQLSHWICGYANQCFLQRNFLDFYRRCLQTQEKCCCSKFSFSTVFYMIENIHKILFMQWRHTQAFFSDLLFKKRPLNVTFTDFLNNQIICFVFIYVFCDSTKQNKVHIFKVNQSYKKEKFYHFLGVKFR